MRMPDIAIVTIIAMALLAQGAAAAGESGAVPQLVHGKQLHRGLVSAIYSDDSYFYTGSFDHFVKAWKKSDFTCAKIFENDDGTMTTDTHENGVRYITGDGSRLYTTADDGTVKVWNRNGFKQAGLIKIPVVAYRSMGLVADDRYLYQALQTAGGLTDINLIVYSTKDYSQVKAIATAQSLIGLFIDDEYVYTVGQKIGMGTNNLPMITQEGTVKLWSKKDLSLAKTLESPADQKSRLTSSLVDGDYVYLASDDNKVRIRSKKDFSLVKTLDVTGEVLGIASDADYIYTLQGSTTMWSKKDFSRVRTLLTTSGADSALEGASTLFVDHYYVYEGLGNGIVRVFNMGKGTPPAPGLAGVLTGRNVLAAVAAIALAIAGVWAAKRWKESQEEGPGYLGELTGCTDDEEAATEGKDEAEGEADEGTESGDEAEEGAKRTGGEPAKAGPAPASKGKGARAAAKPRPGTAKAPKEEAPLRCPVCGSSTDFVRDGKGNIKRDDEGNPVCANCSEDA